MGRVLSFLAFILLSSSGHASRVLLIGGGYEPSASQAVLELNTQIATDLWTTSNSNALMRVLYGGGQDHEILDVVEKVSEPTQAQQLFSDIFFESQCVGCEYRHNHLQMIDGAATQSEVSLRLKELGTELRSDEKVRLYYTGHGHGGHDPDLDGENYRNNYLNLWDGTMDVQTFTSELDELPKETPIQAVMVQCFSGGFAMMNFQGGKAVAGQEMESLSDANRCGFFSQIPQMPAAGCSESLLHREEYSPYFWSAYRGSDEKGNAVDADYNRDGRITSDEAHAYVVIHEDAEDVPVTTSQMLIQDFVALKEVSVSAKRATWSVLMESMTDSEKAIVLGLHQQLEFDLTSQDPAIGQLKKAVQEISLVVKGMTEVKRGLTETYLGHRKVIYRDIVDRFPMLGSNLPMVFDVGLKAKSSQAWERFQNHPRLGELQKAYDYVAAMESEIDSANRRLTKWQRLAFLTGQKILEGKIPEMPQRLQDKFKQLKACEAEPFIAN